MSRTKDQTYMRMRKHLFENNDVCWICAQWIDPELKFPHPFSKTADHVHPIGKGGHPYGPLRTAHLRCNQRRGAKLPPVKHARGW